MTKTTRITAAPLHTHLTEKQGNATEHLYTVFRKKLRHQTHGGHSVKSQLIFTTFFTVRYSSDFAAKHLLKTPPHLICVATPACETLMSENERHLQTKVVINEITTYSSYIFKVANNQIQKGLLLSLPLKNFKNQ